VSRHGQASAEDRLCNQQLGILAGYTTTNVLRASGHDLVDVSHHVSRSEYLGNQKVHQADISCIAKAAHGYGCTKRNVSAMRICSDYASLCGSIHDTTPFVATPKKATRRYTFEYRAREHENVLSWATHGDVWSMTIAKFAKFGLLDKIVEYLSYDNQPIHTTAMKYAIGNRHYSCLDVLVGVHAPVDKTCVHAAIATNRSDILQYLIEDRGHIVTRTDVEYAVLCGKARCVRYLLHAGNGTFNGDALRYALRHSARDCLRALVDKITVEKKHHGLTHTELKREAWDNQIFISSLWCLSRGCQLQCVSRAHARANLGVRRVALCLGHMLEIWDILANNSVMCRDTARTVMTFM